MKRQEQIHELTSISSDRGGSKLPKHQPCQYMNLNKGNDIGVCHPGAGLSSACRGDKRLVELMYADTLSNRNTSDALRDDSGNGRAICHLGRTPCRGNKTSSRAGERRTPWPSPLFYSGGHVCIGLVCECYSFVRFVCNGMACTLTVPLPSYRSGMPLLQFLSRAVVDTPVVCQQEEHILHRLELLDR